ncbi:MAG TPA: hypothetical protein VK195_09720 [Burkholderiaceae bacterium]|nr:hypothetical protein [Burkholderiaceae bacterium]
MPPEGRRIPHHCEVNMTHISEVNEASVLRYPDIGGDRILVVAQGLVPTSGWSGIRLTRRYSAVPPADGLMEFDFVGEAPSGPVLEVMLPVAALKVADAPDWLRGVKIYAAGGCLEVTELKPAALTRNSLARAPAPGRPRGVLYRQDLASYDDSFNVIGSCGLFSLKMKKLRHTLTLTVEGPDEARIRRCVEEATAVGLIAAIVAAFATGGGGLSAAVSAFIGQLQGCLGDAFTITVEDHSDWIEWCT